jgi:hypothetical protein
MRQVTVIGPRTAVLFGCLAALLAACDGGAEGGGGPNGSPTPTPIARPSSTAELTIVSPENGELIRGPAVRLRIQLEGGTIVPQTSTDLRPNEGHLHVLIDDALISMTEGLEQTITDVEPGLHRLTVEFVATDHAPFDPRVVAVVAFQVRR